MSLEMMLYASLAGLSLVFASGAVAKESATIGGASAAFEASQFVDSLNGVLVSGDTSKFTMFVPYGLCNSTVSGPELEYRGIRLYLADPLAFSGSPLCPDGVAASLEIAYNRTGAYLVRVR